MTARLLSFHLGDRCILDVGRGCRRHRALSTAGSRYQLQPLIKKLVSQRLISAMATAASTAGAALYQALFQAAGATFPSRQVAAGCWRFDDALSVGQRDIDSLFEVPFAALPIPPEVERVQQGFSFLRRGAIPVKVVPSVAFWLARGNPAESGADASLFLGIGDPIYNSADPRLAEIPRAAALGRHSSPSRILFAASLPPPPAAVGSERG